MPSILSAVGIAAGLYQAMLLSAATVGLLTACPADPEICGKARQLATNSGIALVGCVALAGVGARLNRG